MSGPLTLPGPAPALASSSAPASSSPCTSARSSLSLSTTSSSTDPCASFGGPPETPLTEPDVEAAIAPALVDKMPATVVPLRPGQSGRGSGSGNGSRRSSSYEHPKRSTIVAPERGHLAADSERYTGPGPSSRRRSKSGGADLAPSPPLPEPMSDAHLPALCQAQARPSVPVPDSIPTRRRSREQKEDEDYALPSQSFSFGTCPSIPLPAPELHAHPYTLGPDPLRSTPTAEMGEFHYSLPPSYPASPLSHSHAQTNPDQAGASGSASRRSSRGLAHTQYAYPAPPAPLELGQTYRRNSIVAHLTSLPPSGPGSGSGRLSYPSNVSSDPHAGAQAEPEFSPPPTRRSSTCSTLLPLPAAGRRPSILHSSSTNSGVPAHQPEQEGTVLVAPKGSALAGLIEAALAREAAGAAAVEPETSAIPAAVGSPRAHPGAAGESSKVNDKGAERDPEPRTRRTSTDRPAYPPPNMHLDRRRPSLLFQPPRLPTPIPPSLLARRGSLPASQLLGPGPGGSVSPSGRRDGPGPGSALVAGDVGPILVPSRAGSLSFAFPQSPTSASALAGAGPAAASSAGPTPAPAAPAPGEWTTTAAALYRRSSFADRSFPSPHHPHPFAFGYGRRDSALSVSAASETTESDTHSSYSSSSVRTALPPHSAATTPGGGPASPAGTEDAPYADTYARRPSSPGFGAGGGFPLALAGAPAGGAGMIRRTSSPLVPGVPRRGSSLTSPPTLAAAPLSTGGAYATRPPAHPLVQPETRPRSPASPSSGARYAPASAVPSYQSSRARHSSSTSASSYASGASRGSLSHALPHRTSIRSSLSGPSISSASASDEDQDQDVSDSALDTRSSSASGRSVGSGSGSAWEEGSGSASGGDGEGEGDDAPEQELETPGTFGMFTDPWAGVRKGGMTGMGMGMGGAMGPGQTSPVVEEGEGEGLDTPPAI